jgi:hypothetical protein
MASRERPPMTFEEAMEKAARDKARGAPENRVSIEQRKAAGIPSLYHVEVYLQVAASQVHSLQQGGSVLQGMLIREQSRS